MIVKEKVLVYFLRKNNEQFELLVFDHLNMPEAGTQIIGGTVEHDEDLKESLIREIYEESGLVIKMHELKELGKTVYKRLDREEINHRTYFLYTGETSKIPDYFEHVVKSNGEDNGIKYLHYWLTLKRAESQLTGNFGELISQI